MDTPFKEAAVPNFLPYEILPPSAISLLFIRHQPTCPLAQGLPGKADHTPFHTSLRSFHQAKAPKKSSSSKFQCCDKDKSIYTLQNFKIRFQAVLFYSIF